MVFTVVLTEVTMQQEPAFAAVEAMYTYRLRTQGNRHHPFGLLFLARRPLLRPCLDWSERRPHIGGQLGARLLDALLARGWVRRRRDSRAMLVSDEGERMLSRWSAKC